MEPEPTPDDPAVHSQSENALLVELCRYYAQVLYAARDGLDDLIPTLPKINLPQDGVIPAQTVLLDGVAKPYLRAAATLVQCGVATEQGHLSGRYLLDVSSKDFEVGAGQVSKRRLGSVTADAFLEMFSIYEVNQYLGHPDTLSRIFSLFLQVGLTQQRYGYVEWSPRALDLATNKGVFGSISSPADLLWNPDTFEVFVQEAEAQWLGGKGR